MPVPPQLPMLNALEDIRYFCENVSVFIRVCTEVDQMLTNDQKARLTAAAINLADLIDDPEFLIDLWTGAAGKLDDKTLEEHIVPDPAEYQDQENNDMAGRRKITKVDLPADRTAQMVRWVEVKKQLDAAQNEEHQLRTQLVMDNFTKEKMEGSETIDVGFGYRLTAEKVMNYSATNASGQTSALLDAITQIDPAISVGLVTWKPEISVKVYRQVLVMAESHPELNRLLAAAITVKPGLPQLELKKHKDEVNPVAPVAEAAPVFVAPVWPATEPPAPVTDPPPLFPNPGAWPTGQGFAASPEQRWPLENVPMEESEPQTDDSESTFTW